MSTLVAEETEGQPVFANLPLCRREKNAQHWLVSKQGGYSYAWPCVCGVWDVAIEIYRAGGTPHPKQPLSSCDPSMAKCSGSYLGESQPFRLET